MTPNGLVTGRVFTKLFFSFVLVLFLGMVVLDFSLRQVMEQSLRTQAEESLVGQARVLAGHLGTADPASLNSQALQQIAVRDASSTGADVSFFSPQGQLLATSRSEATSGDTPASEVTAITQDHRSLGRAQRGGTLFVAVPAGPLV